jgi:hypothetical protein
MTPDDLAAIERMTIDFNAEALAVEVHRLRTEKVDLAAKNGDLGMRLVEALAEVDRLTAQVKSQRMTIDALDGVADRMQPPWPGLAGVERARILAGVEGLPGWMESDWGDMVVTPTSHLIERAAVIAIVKGEK